ncbi:hypothetical protein DSECCO2_657280 [anaerobic digester metagenome]
MLPICVRNQGTAFGHAITDGEGEFDLLHKEFHFRVHWRSPRDQFTDVSPEGRHQLIVYLFQDDLVQPGDLQQDLHLLGLNGGLKLLFVYLFDQ